ncbi:DUF6538 domain-containing protein [Azospirillum argentinense]
MAGRKMPYIIRRGNVYWYRRGIPATIQHIVGKGTHWCVSLRTSDSTEAKRLAAATNLEVQKAFDAAMKQVRLPKNPQTLQAGVPKVLDVKGACALAVTAAQYRERYAFHAAVNSKRPEGTLKLAELRKGLVTAGEDSELLIAALFEDTLRDANYLIAPDSPAYKVGLSKFRSTLTGAVDNAIQWADGEFDYIPDHVMAESEPTKPSGMTITEAAERYAAERGIAERQLHELRSVVRQFKEAIGRDALLRSLTRDECFDFKTLIQKKPSVLVGEDQRLSLPQLIKKYEDQSVERLTVVTVRKILSSLQALFTWAEANGQITGNPVKGMVPAKPKRAQLTPKRLPFSGDDIKIIFNSPLYTGARSAARLTEPGTYFVSDHRFWLPLLGLWTGCRLEELGQADAADVKYDAGIWFLDITTLDPSGKKVQEKNLKTVSSKRIVPLHPTIIAANFPQYVEMVKGNRLFPLLFPDRFGTFTASYSKLFGRWLDRSGISDPLKVFHSFRHSFKDACRAAQIPVEIHDRLTGHASNTVGGAYGIGVPLTVLSEHMNRITYPTFVTPPSRQF